ncbi:hypothetical protein [Piscinibacter sp. HJYY11]|uniref:hypothetical protein n=1 Tax=Piscinibacter sp. HJYY11 TaxID=2801333 RepID=UPI001F327AB1|nr:hypothetical protein [Piscinibacter sp. HJYY11]
MLQHAAVRIVSGLLSIYLFSLIAKHYAAGDAKDILFFLFVLGFFAAALRSLSAMAAALDRHTRTSDKLRRVAHSAQTTAIGSALLMPVIMFVLGRSHPPALVLAAAALLIFTCALDGDLVRALVARPPLFSTLFAAGNLISVTWLHSQNGWPRDAAFIAVLLQWLPVCVVNGWVAMRRLCPLRMQIGAPGSRSAAYLATILCVALFDGLVLNLPFLFGKGLPAEVGLDIAVVIRIFSASLLFFPLGMHWLNSGAIGRFANRLHWQPLRTYLVFQLVASLVTGIGFATFFVLFSHRTMSISQFVAFGGLVTAYCTYASFARFHGALLPGRQLVPGLLVVLGTLLVAFLVIPHLTTPGALSIAVIQALGLAAGSAMIVIIQRTRGTATSQGQART